jgi:hypothetical protein
MLLRQFRLYQDLHLDSIPANLLRGYNEQGDQYCHGDSCIQRYCGTIHIHAGLCPNRCVLEHTQTARGEMHQCRHVQSHLRLQYGSCADTLPAPTMQTAP